MTETKYFDLHTTGIGYLNRIREVSPKQGKPFWATDISALSGSADNVQYTRFDCKVAGTEAEEVIKSVEKDVEDEKKVLVSFKIGDLYTDTFTYSKGKRAGETGVSLKTRLLKIYWVKVDGETVYTAPKPETESDADQADDEASAVVSDANQDASSESVSDYLPEEVDLNPEDDDFEQKKSRLKEQGYRYDRESKSWKLPQAA